MKRARADRRHACALACTAILLGCPGSAASADEPSDAPVRADPPAGEASRAARAPLPPPGFLEGTLKLIQQERYEEARQLLGPVVSNHPGWARAHFYLALTYHQEHRYQQARELFERVLELDPLYSTPRVYYGWCLYYLGDVVRSREMFESYLAIKPDYADAIFALGLIDFDSDDIPSARARFLRVIELSGKTNNRSAEAKARARLADIHVRTDDLGKARTELERSIELNPRNYETYFKLSRVLQQLGDVEGAERARQMHQTVRQQVRPASRPPGRYPED